MNNEPTMTDLMEIMGGFKISNSEAESRIVNAVKKIGMEPKDALQKWRSEGNNTKIVGTDSINNFLKTYYVGAKSKGWGSKSDSDVYDLIKNIRAADAEKQVLDAIDKQSIGGKRDKAKRAAKSVGAGIAGGARMAKSAASSGKQSFGKGRSLGKKLFSENLIFEDKESDATVREFFEILLDRYGQDDNGSVNEDIVSDFLDTELTSTKLQNIISIIDQNNKTGAYSAVKDSILSKWNNSSIDTGTLKSINTELMALSSKGLDI